MSLDKTHYRENFETTLEDCIDTIVIGEVVVRKYRSHVRISKRDWKIIKPLIVSALKQGDKDADDGDKEYKKEYYTCGG